MFLPCDVVNGKLQPTSYLQHPVGRRSQALETTSDPMPGPTLSCSTHTHSSPPSSMTTPYKHHASSVVPAQLAFLAIYNPTLGPTDETFADQLVFWYSRK